MDPKPKTNTIEASVKKALNSGPKTNTELRKQLGVSGSSDSKLDRTLQKLRKENKIRVDKGRWFLTSAQVCDKCGGKGWVDGKAAK